MRRWQEEAACEGVPFIVFHPESNGFVINSRDWRAENASLVERYCKNCPVRLPCYAFAQETLPEDSRGVWGGMDFIERRRNLSNGKPVRCTTWGCRVILDPLDSKETCGEHG